MQTYKELQLNLKAFKESGHVLLVKLNAKREVLEQEYLRLQMVEQLEYADTQSELPQLEEVEEEMSILSLEGVSSLTAQYSLANDTTYINTTKGKVSWLTRALSGATTTEEEQLEQQIYATEQLVRATRLTERVIEDLWESTEGIVVDTCMQESVEVPMYYQLCLPPAPDTVKERVPHMVHPLIVFLLPIVAVMLMVTVVIKVANTVVPLVVQMLKFKLNGWYSVVYPEPLFT